MMAIWSSNVKQFMHENCDIKKLTIDLDRRWKIAL